MELCSETLRPLLKKLKDEINGDYSDKNDGRETCCECTDSNENNNSAKDKLSLPVIDEEGDADSSCIRKESPVSEVNPEINIRFVHHLGVTIFSSVLQKVEALNNTAGWLVKQWLSALFLGTVNIEQSKLLDFESLNTGLGRTLLSRCPQRKERRSAWSNKLIFYTSYYPSNEKAFIAHLIKGICPQQIACD